GRDDRGLFLDLIVMMLRLLEPRPPRPPVASTPTGRPIRRKVRTLEELKGRPKAGGVDRTKAASEAGPPRPWRRPISSRCESTQCAPEEAEVADGDVLKVDANTKRRVPARRLVIPSVGVPQ